MANLSFRIKTNIRLTRTHKEELKELISLVKDRTIEEVKQKKPKYIHLFNDGAEYVDIEHRHIVGTIYKAKPLPYLDNHFDIYTTDEGYEDYNNVQIGDIVYMKG